jgi:hypothetical protein
MNAEETHKTEPAPSKDAPQNQCEIENEDELENYAPLTTTEKFTEREKGNLAKWILAVTALIYFAISALAIVCNQSIAEKVWSATSNAVLSIVLVVIGYYFGIRKNH